MKGQCHGCGEKGDVEPFSHLCVDCLIALARRLRQKDTFDPKAAASRNDE